MKIIKLLGIMTLTGEGHQALDHILFLLEVI